MKYSNMEKVTYKIKQIIDCCISWVVLLFISPIIWLVALFIKIDSPGSIFFRQVRIGQNGQPFLAYKFRSMLEVPSGCKAPIDAERITRVGKFLRATSLDELPQLFNVIRGEMSLIGPRPTLPYQVAAYNNFQRRRLLVKPGITGWAQINGRNSIPWEDRIILDVWYIEHLSLQLDFLILLKTLKVWLRGQDIYGPSGVNFDFGNPEAISSQF
jgi:undecaprenyl phosphate N,N'-diacetylbacillosamine 1-phosphate transferase